MAALCCLTGVSMETVRNNFFRLTVINDKNEMDLEQKKSYVLSNLIQASCISAQVFLIKWLLG